MRGALEHVEVIEDEIRRLDQVVQGFLKFTPSRGPAAAAIVWRAARRGPAGRAAEAEKRGVQIVVRMPARPARRERRSRHAAAGVPQPGDERLSGDAVRRHAAVRWRAAPAGGAIEVSFEDTGVGIARESGAIFDLYFTTKEQGTGIGLSMVYLIVQMHDGDIEVESTPGSGTRFRLLLPQA